MPSVSYRRWRTVRATVLDDIEAARTTIGGTGHVRRSAMQQINRAYQEQTKALTNGDHSTAGPGPANGTTPYHAAYYAHDLTRRSASDSVARSIAFLNSSRLRSNRWMAPMSDGWRCTATLPSSAKWTE